MKKCGSQEEVVESMLARLGDVAASAIVAPMKACYGQGETPLFIAASCGHLEVVKCFIEQLGDTAVIKKAINTLRMGLHYGLTILQGAIMDSTPYIQPRNIEVVKYLLQNGASLRLSEHEVRKFKEEPQLKKTYRLYQEFVKCSEENKFDSLNNMLIKLTTGECILGFSINDNGDNMLHALVNAYINSANGTNKSVIQHCIEALIALDTDRVLDTRNKDGKTAMHLYIAAFHGYFALAESMLANLGYTAAASAIILHLCNLASLKGTRCCILLRSMGIKK